MSKYERWVPAELVTDGDEWAGEVDYWSIDCGDGVLSFTAKSENNMARRWYFPVSRLRVFELGPYDKEEVESAVR